MDIKLELSLNDIYDSVHEASTDVGLKQNMVGQLTRQGFQRTASTKYDEDFLKTYVQEACNLFTSSFQRYSPILSINEHYQIVDGEVNYDKLYKVINVSLNLPSNAKNITRAIEPLFNEFFKDYILYKWFINVDNNEASVYKAQVDASIIGFKRVLNERKAPTRIEPTKVQYNKTNYE